MMSQINLGRIITCGVLAALPFYAAMPAQSRESMRIGRPTEADKRAVDAVKSKDPESESESSPALASPPGEPATSYTGTSQPSAVANPGALPSNLHMANATVNLLEQSNQPNPSSMDAIYDWQSKNMPTNLKGRTGASEADVFSSQHRGLKSHLGGALSVMVGTVANSYMPVRNVQLPGAPQGDPKISIEPGHCPAAFDPAFQVPVKWWSILSTEEGQPVLRDQWKFWLSAVKDVFQAHAFELHETPGVASLHVMVNPDGSIFNISPYTGAERGNSGYAINGRTMANLQHIILSVGRFPPFPRGSQVRCYHLVVDGSSN